MATVTSTIDERVQSELEGYTASWQGAQEKFSDTFATNPEYAIEWLSEGVVASQTKHVVAHRILEHRENLRGVVEHEVESLGREIRYNGGHSTSAYANANWNVARAAKVEVLERLESFASAYAAADPVIPENVQVALGELGEALMHDDSASYVERAVDLLNGTVKP